MITFTITYGRKGGPRSGHIREGRRGVANPSFTVIPGETPGLRLNSDVGLRFQSDQLAQIPGNGEKLDYLKFEILGALDLFAQYQRTFLDRYFAFITDQCRDAADDLVRLLDWSGGLFRPDDYFFSAFWPLPDARVVCARDGVEEALGDFDFAFWTGRRVFGVSLLGGAAGSGNEENTAKPAPLDPFWPVSIRAGELHDGQVPFVTPRFPEEFISFWSGQQVPCSPFRPVGLSSAPALPE